jgi:hypothetical protein
VFNDNRENEGTNKENLKDMINQNNCKCNKNAECKIKTIQTLQYGARLVAAEQAMRNNAMSLFTKILLLL